METQSESDFPSCQNALHVPGSDSEPDFFIFLPSRHGYAVINEEGNLVLSSIIQIGIGFVDMLIGPVFMIFQTFIL